MIWQLTDEWRINVIPLNFVLEQYREGGVDPRTKKQGKPKWVVCGYYSTLEQAISAIPDEIAQHPEVQDWQGLKQRIDALAGQLARRIGK